MLKPTLEQREVTRLTHVPPKTKNWAYSGLKNKWNTKQVYNIYDHICLEIFVFSPLLTIYRYKICPNHTSKQVCTPLSPFLSRCFGRGQARHDVSSLSLHHGVHLRLHLKCVHAIRPEHLEKRQTHTCDQQLTPQ